MERILAIDYGEKRTGLAVSDELQLIANGLTTVATADLMSFLADYIRIENVETIVVGYPLYKTQTASLQRVKKFVAKLKIIFQNIEIVKEDERFTSRLAKQAMRSAGLSKKKRQNKALIDKISATIILQSYLERKRIKEKESL